MELTNEHGLKFLKEIRKIYGNTGERATPGRAARVIAFTICYMLNRNSDYAGPNYELYVRTESGDLEPVIFSHHEL